MNMRGVDFAIPKQMAEQLLYDDRIASNFKVNPPNKSSGSGAKIQYEERLGIRQHRHSVRLKQGVEIGII